MTHVRPSLQANLYAEASHARRAKGFSPKAPHDEELPEGSRRIQLLRG